jgi:hypothetical protein
MLSYAEALPVLLDLMQRRVTVVISTLDAEANAWTAIAVIQGHLKRAEAEDLDEIGAPGVFSSGESTTLRLDIGGASALIIMSEENCRGGLVDENGALGLYLGHAHVVISPEEAPT